MSRDKHRSLARRVAWLRLGARECGFATGVRHAPAIDADVLRLEAEGLLERSRAGIAGRAGSPVKSGAKAYTCFAATPTGVAFLAAAIAARGEGFGPTGLAVGPENHGLTKTERRRRAAPPRRSRDLPAAQTCAR